MKKNYKPLTFAVTGEAVQFDEAQVVSGHQDGGRVVGVHGVYFCSIRVFRPNPADLRPQNPAPRGPALTLDLLLGERRFPNCNDTEAAQ